MASALPVEVRAGAACTIEYEVREGRPTSVTCALYEPDGTAVSPTPTAYRDATETTVTSAWASGVRELVLDDGADLRAGRTYWLQGSRGVWEPVRCVGRGAGASTGTLYAADAIEEEFDVADSPPLVSRRVYASFTAPTTLGENYYVEWTYVLTDPVDGTTTTRKERSYLHAVRQPWPVPFLRVDELRAILRGVATADGQATLERGEWYAMDIADAVEAVRARLISRGLKPWLYKSPAAFQRATAYEVLAAWVRRGEYLPPGFGVGRDAHEHFETLADREFERALGTAALYDTSDDGVVDDGEAVTDSRRGHFASC